MRHSRLLTGEGHPSDHPAPPVKSGKQEPVNPDEEELAAPYVVIDPEVGGRMHNADRISNQRDSDEPQTRSFRA